MRLFHSETSPYVRKVMVLLHETGLADQVELVPGSGFPTAPNEATRAINPLGKVPALERDDGPAIYDSRVICRYLDHLTGAGLYPEPPRLWDTLTLEATADGILDAALLMVYEGRLRPPEIQWPTWVEAQWEKIEKALHALESRWISHLQGRMDMGQIATACALGYLDFRHGARGWRGIAPGVGAWYDEFAKRPSMAVSASPPA